MEQFDAALRVFHSLIVEVASILRVEILVASDVVVTTDDDFDLELGLLDPIDGFFKL